MSDNWVGLGAPALQAPHRKRLSRLSCDAAFRLRVDMGAETTIYKAEVTDIAKYIPRVACSLTSDFETYPVDRAALDLKNFRKIGRSPPPPGNIVS